MEFQTSYAMTPTQKATVSKVIDGLIRADVVSSAHDGGNLSTDELFELDGVARMTAALDWTED